MAAHGVTRGRNWALETPAHAWMQADIRALDEVRANVLRVFRFWYNNRYCHTGAEANLTLLLGQFYGVWLRVPMAAEFVFNDYTQGLVRYINTDYCAGPELSARSPQVEAPVRELWRALMATHAEVETMWSLPMAERRQYDTVLNTALASLRSWLRIPALNALRTREQQGARLPFPALRQQADLAGALRACSAMLRTEVHTAK